MVNGGLLGILNRTITGMKVEKRIFCACLQLSKRRARNVSCRAEWCLYNSFYANQFETGDFGHRCFDGRGYMPHPGAGRAWWCCTMHGLRAFRDVLDMVVTPKSEYPGDDGQPGIRINLLKEGRWSANDMAVRIERIRNPAGLSHYGRAGTGHRANTGGTCSQLGGNHDHNGNCGWTRSGKCRWENAF